MGRVHVAVQSGPFACVDRSLVDYVISKGQGPYDGELFVMMVVVRIFQEGGRPNYLCGRQVAWPIGRYPGTPGPHLQHHTLSLSCPPIGWRHGVEAMY
jgi:hypothetical protein